MYPCPIIASLEYFFGIHDIQPKVWNILAHYVIKYIAKDLKKIGMLPKWITTYFDL